MRRTKKKKLNQTITTTELTNQRDDERGGRVHVGEEEEEEVEGQQDGDGEGDLLAAVGGQVEDEDGQAGDGHAGHDQVEGVEQGAPPQGDVEGDVGVGLRAARVELHLPQGRIFN